MAKHYYVEGNKVFAEVEKLTAKELAAVKNYRELGFEFFIIEKKEKEQNVDWSKPAIDEFIETYGTDVQKAKYKELTERPAVSKKTNEIIVNKDGSIRKVGLVGAFSWFKEEFPNYPEVKPKKK